MSRHPYHVLRDVVIHAQKFKGNESLFFERSPFSDSFPLFQPMCVIEKGLAKSAYWLNQFCAEYGAVVANLTPHPFSIRLRRELGAIEEMAVERIRRWCWDFVLTPSGMSAIDEKLKTHDETKYVSFLEAALSWRLGKNVAPHANADAWAREAELRGIE